MKITRITYVRGLVLVTLILLLEVLCRLDIIDSKSIVPPSAMVVELVHLIESGEIKNAIILSGNNIIIAFIASVGFGLIVGIILNSLSTLRRIVNPVLTSYYAVPTFAFYPLLIVIFGFSRTPLVVLGFLFGVVAMIMSTLNGLAHLRIVLINTGYTMQMSKINIIWRIMLPSIRPHLFVGIKLALAYAFIGVLGGEFILATNGVGYEIAYAYDSFETRKMYALMLLVIAAVVALNILIFVVEHKWVDKTT